jgi:O-succinylbenzoate synthase
VTTSPLDPVDGGIAVRRVEVDVDLLDHFTASPERTAWWLDRLRRTHALLG